MNCPKCHAETVVIDSRARFDNSIRRRRRCLDCYHRFTSHEVSTEAIEQQSSQKQTERIIEAREIFQAAIDDVIGLIALKDG